ncbi:hypothetical protein [Bradyrhizobium sp.]|uniref:hypothetical protein n=1 Tax=Bradyrhizobium sp. TaxID=376 RepID=UPI003BB18F05
MTDFRPDIVARIIEPISGEVAVGGPRKRGDTGQGDSPRSGLMTGRAQGALALNFREDDAKVRGDEWPSGDRPTASVRRGS